MISRIEPSKRQTAEKPVAKTKLDDRRATPGETAPTVRIVKDNPAAPSAQEGSLEPKVGETTIQE